MTGFDVRDASRARKPLLSFPRIKKIICAVAKEDLRGWPRCNAGRALPLTGKNVFEKIFSSLLLADWTAVAIADGYGLESEQVPMVEEFKALMKK